jgi:hypothetical protein
MLTMKMEAGVSGCTCKEEKVLTVSLDESLELLEVDLLFGTSSTHCILVYLVLFSVVCASLPSDLLY